MLPIIIEAAENFCVHQIRLPYEFSSEAKSLRTLLAYIEIGSNDGAVYKAYIGCNSELIQKITEIFLGEYYDNKETQENMLLETANMVIGSAKVIASDKYDLTIKMATPFLADIDNVSFDECAYIEIENGEMLIAITKV
jgi:hypothetical protein